MNIIKRKNASIEGLKFFYSGKPCKNGHDSKRYTSTGGCVMCLEQNAADYTRQNRNAARARQSGHFVRELHPDDFLKLEAYAMALDFDRGIIRGAVTTPDELERQRQAAAPARHPSQDLNDRYAAEKQATLLERIARDRADRIARAEAAATADAIDYMPKL